MRAPELALRAGLTLLLFLAYEFGYWLDHYLSHAIPLLWAFHKSHHSAETLTPWTVWRVHPVDSLVFANVQAVVMGTTAGGAAYFLGAGAPIFAIDGTNVLLVLFVYAYVHLQHSQIWIAFTGPLGRILMSPAHHQIHHSADPAHFNRNLGSCLAVWDWLFGTLHAPGAASPRLTFGVESDGRNPHSLIQLLLTPFSDALSSLTSKSASRPRTGEIVARR